MKILRIEHIAIASPDTTDAKETLARLGLIAEEEEPFPALQAIRTAYRIGDIQLEVLQGSPATPIVGPWLRQHGEGLCHICFEVDDLDGALADLEASGIMTLAGVHVSRGRRTAFLDPATTANVFLELAERADGSSVPPAA